MISIEGLISKENRLYNNSTKDVPDGLAVDTFIGGSHADLGEGSEEIALRSNRSRTMLREGQIPSYYPH